MTSSDFKQERLKTVSGLLSAKQAFTDLEMDLIYDAAFAYPEDVKVIMASLNPTFFREYFAYFFQLMEDQPQEFKVYNKIPQLLANKWNRVFTVVKAEGGKMGGMVPRFMKFIIHPNTPILQDKGLDIFDGDLHFQTGPWEIKLSYSGLIGFKSQHPKGVQQSFYAYHDGRLRHKGITEMFHLIEQIKGVLICFHEEPAFLLGLYTLFYEEVRSRKPHVEYGKIAMVECNSEMSARYARIYSKHRGMQISSGRCLLQSIENMVFEYFIFCDGKSN